MGGNGTKVVCEDLKKGNELRECGEAKGIHGSGFHFGQWMFKGRGLTSTTPAFKSTLVIKKKKRKNPDPLDVQGKGAGI